MSFWGSLGAVVSAVATSEQAIAAARRAWAADGSPLAILRAAAAAIDTPLATAAVADVEAGLRQAIDALTIAVTACASAAVWIETRRPVIVRTVDQALGIAIDLGFRAIGWRATLEGWRR